MDASCKIQRSIHDVRLTYKYVSRILGTYQSRILQGSNFFILLFAQFFSHLIQLFHILLTQGRHDLNSCIKPCDIFCSFRILLS